MPILNDIIERIRKCLFQGIFISRVTEHGPAAQAGIMVGDKVISVNGKKCPCNKISATFLAH